jgi:hypothetical protein
VPFSFFSANGAPQAFLYFTIVGDLLIQKGRSDLLMPIMGGYRSQATIAWDSMF